MCVLVWTEAWLCDFKRFLFQPKKKKKPSVFFIDIDKQKGPRYFGTEEFHSSGPEQS